ncbi:MAG: ABC transporter permease [Bacteroidota bacterium]
MNILFRKIRKKPISFLLGQASMILGILSCLIIFSFVLFHLSFDTFYPQVDKIYRINRKGNDSNIRALTEGTLKSVIQANFTSSKVTHFMQTPVDLTFNFNDHQITESEGLLVDRDFFTIFNDKLILGKTASALSHPNSVVLTKSVAEKLFKNVDTALNKIVKIKFGPRDLALTVTGVIRDNPTNSGLRYTYLLTGSSLPFWRDENPQTVLNTFIKVNQPGEATSVANFLNVSSTENTTYKLQPISDIHFADGIEFDIFEKFDQKYLKILISIGVLILVVTVFNFLNLFYTQTLSRVREIAVRKVMGTTKSTVFNLIFSELFFSIILSVALSFTLLLAINQRISVWTGFLPLEFLSVDFLIVFLLGISFISIVFAFLVTSQIIGFDIKSPKVIENSVITS